MTFWPRPTSKEWQWAISWSLVVLAFSCLPYVIATLAAPEGWRFAGILVNPLDGHSYMAKMQQGVAGNWLFHLTYTPEPHAGTFIFTFYLALGHLAGLTGLSKITIFHMARLLAGLGLLLMAFRFIVRLSSTRTERRLAFIFIFSASGLGWLGAILGLFPIDLWVPEAFVPYSLFANPHFPLAMMFMLIIFEQVLSFDFQTSNFAPAPPLQTNIETQEAKLNHLRPALYAGLAALALAMILPFALLTVWAILLFFLGWRYVTTRRLPWVHIWPTLGVVLFSAPLILYQYRVSTTNPILIAWGTQNVTPAPQLLDFWFGYGPVGLLAGLGAGYVLWRDRQKSTIAEYLVLIWAVTTVVLVYIPFDLQRRLITGLHLPLALLAATGLSRWLADSNLRFNYQQLITMAVITVGILGTLAIWGISLIGVLQSPAESAVTALFFIRDEEQAAFEWLQTQVEPDDVILASPRVGMFVPGQTGARSFYGHPFETTEAEAKKAQTESFYQGKLETVSPPAKFIIYGPSEQLLGRPVNLSSYPIVFSAGRLSVYGATQ